MTTTADLPVEIDIQKEAGRIVEEHVYCNVGALVDYCIERMFEGDEKNPLSEDDIDLRVDPSGWDDDELNRYLTDDLGTDWENVTGETWPKENSKDEIKAVRSYITGSSERQARIDFGEGPVKDWDEETLFRFLEEEMGDSWSDITGHRFPGTEIDEDETDKVKEYIRENADQREVYEWWAISPWLAAKLKGREEIVIDLGQLDVWGRQTTGQAIKMDGDIQAITLELLKQRAAYA